MADPTPADEAELIKMLRAEAHDVKECFTRFSFQGLLLVGAVWGFMIRFQADYPIIGFSGFGLAMLLLSIGRIGAYKYATANRNLGYELHLQRTRRLGADKGSGWHDSMRTIGWEEAMRAWRIVQATLFEAMYESRRLRPKVLKQQFRQDPPTKEAEPWFDPKRLLLMEASYYPGGYLSTMLLVLKAAAVLSLLPMLATTLQYAADPGFSGGAIGILVLLLLDILTIAIFWSIVRILDARLDVLERELLCIHSSAIVWQAVVVAHFRALQSLKHDRSDQVEDFRGYTRALSAQALSLAHDAWVIHDWIVQGPSKSAQDYLARIQARSLGH